MQKWVMIMEEKHLEKTKPYDPRDLKVAHGENLASLEEIELPDLKKIRAISERKVINKQKEIDAAIDEFSKGVKLPKEVVERFEKTFGRGTTKKAVRRTIFFFALVFLLLLFFQPSMLTASTQTELKITNLSERQINNVAVYDLGELPKLFSGGVTPICEKNTLDGKEELVVEVGREGIFLVTAERQLPAIGLVFKS